MNQQLSFRERRIIAQRKYREKNREMLNEKNRLYEIANKDKRKIRTRKYYLENKEKVRAANDRWRANNPEAYRDISVAATARRRARKKSSAIGRVSYKTVRERLGMICGICLEAIVGKYEYDHIIPLSKGGTHTTENLQLAHRGCNQWKRDEILE